MCTGADCAPRLNVTFDARIAISVDMIGVTFSELSKGELS
jgi:hypothetical protein